MKYVEARIHITHFRFINLHLVKTHTDSHFVKVHFMIIFDHAKITPSLFAIRPHQSYDMIKALQDASKILHGLRTSKPKLRLSLCKVHK